MVSLELTPNSEIGNDQENNNMQTFLQTVGHQHFDTLDGFTACLTAFQTLSDREYYLYRKAMARKAEDLPFTNRMQPQMLRCL